MYVLIIISFPKWFMFSSIFLHTFLLSTIAFAIVPLCASGHAFRHGAFLQADSSSLAPQNDISVVWYNRPSAVELKEKAKLGGCNTMLRYCAVFTTILCLMLTCLSYAELDSSKPGAQGLMPDPDTIIRNILGVDEMSKNVCLIDSRQMVNAADLPGRLVAISSDRQIPSDLLRYSFRKSGAKVKTQLNPPTNPIQVTRLESGQANTGSLLNWFGASMAKEDIAELRTVPMPATSISVDDLDEQSITDRFSKVPADVRKGLGIITDVIPYEVYASICKKTTGKAEAGVWYIKLGKDTYCRQSDELRKYYLVVVYTPIMFYDDIGVFSNEKSWSIDSTWQVPGKTRAAAFKLWLKDHPQTGKFSVERKVGYKDTPNPVQPKPKH